MLTPEQRATAAADFAAYQTTHNEQTGVTREELKAAFLAMDEAFPGIYATVAASIPESVRSKLTTVQVLRVLEKLAFVAFREGVL